MKEIIFKILSVIILIIGLVLSIIEKEPVTCFFGFIAGIICYELAIIIGNTKK